MLLLVAGFAYIYMKSLVTKRDKGQSEKITPAKTSTIDRKIQSRFHLFAKCDISNVYIAFLKTNGSGIVFSCLLSMFSRG